MNIPIYQVDAFTNALFKGNPAAVCPLEDWLPDEQLLAIAAENNLSETAFFKPNGNAFDLRWFTPGVEVDLCGHATLATAHVLFQHLGFKEGIIDFHSKSGLLQVTQQDNGYQMNFPADSLESTPVPTAILKALGFPPKEIYKGKDDYLVIVTDQSIIESLAPDFRALVELNARGVIVSAPGKEVDFVSRCFYSPTGIDEDPVTGSAHTTMMPYWSKKLAKQELLARQLSKRGGQVGCRLDGDRVYLTGQAVTYLIGQIYL